jgi:hypothetical protein
MGHLRGVHQAVVTRIISALYTHVMLLLMDFRTGMMPAMSVEQSSRSVKCVTRG